MLSIGKLGVGHAQYYELSVADGRDDYYSGKGEEQGAFIGEGARALDLDGALAHGDLSALVRGQHPATGRRWHHRQQQAKQAPRVLRLKSGEVIERPASEPVAAFDLTFSAPKSVSVLWALSDGPIAADVKEAHTEAVRQAFGYMERVACVTRRGKGGSEHVRGEGFVGAAFTHRSSRAGDPQLHTHVVIANATRATSIDARGREVTRYTALHGALLYREAKTAGYLYQAALRRELTRRLGVEWTRAVNGQAEIVGVDRALRDTFSKRADEIANQLALAGLASAKAANAAAIDTRASKDYSVDGAHLKSRWFDEARGVDAPDVLDAIGRTSRMPQVPMHDDPMMRALREELFAPDGLTQQRTTFARRDVVRAVSERLPAGMPVSVIERLADGLLNHAADRVVLLERDEPVPLLAAARADGTRHDDHRTDHAYTTRELLDAEHRVVESMHERAHADAARLSASRVAAMLDARSENQRLAPEQRRMVERLTTSGAGVEVVVGLGGAGKTFSLAAAREAWAAGGVEVRGCAIADAATRNLEAEAGIASRTIATLKMWATPEPGSGFEPQPERAFPPGGVLVVDEAGMVPTRDLAFLVDGCERHGTKLVLVGDHRQLPEIDAGGSFRGLVHRFEPEQRVSRLGTNRRQRHEWEHAALSDLRAGSVTDAISAYAEHDRITTRPEPARLRERLVTDWLDARERNSSAAMIAYTREDVAHLNRLARTALDERGALGRERVTVAGTEWARGDEFSSFAILGSR